MSILKRTICLSLIVMALHAQSVFPHENNIQIIEGEEYVYTPFGIMLRECVQGVPSGTHVQKADDGSLHLTNDQQNFVKRVPINERCSKRNSQSQPNGWQAYASWRFEDATESLQKFEANFLVPDTPAAVNNQKLQYSILAINEQDDLRSAIQSTLTFKNGWYSQSWYLDAYGQAQSSTPVYGNAPGDLASGSLEVQDDIITIISSNKDGEQSVLTIDREGRNYTYFRVSLDTENISSCSNYPATYMEFSQMNIIDSNGTVVSPNWWPSRSLQCHGVTTVINSATVRISQDASLTGYTQ